MPEEKHGPNRTNRPNEPEPTENLGRWIDSRDLGDVQTGGPGNEAFDDGAFGDKQQPPPPPLTGSDDDAYPLNREIREDLQDR